MCITLPTSSTSQQQPSILRATAWWKGHIVRQRMFYTVKKEKEIFLILEEIQIVSVAKSYMRKSFLI
jgi:hypothetical protein